MNINIAIPDDLHRQLRLEAARRGVTLKQLVTSYLRKGVIRDNKQRERDDDREG